VIVERANASGDIIGRDVHGVGGANHFLHMIDHVAKCIRDREAPLFPAEDGVANVEACAAILEACTRPSPLTS
jgi:hypothetical protein